MSSVAPPPRAAARREPDCHDALVESARVGRAEELRRAMAFARVAASCHFVFHGCASVGEYGLRIGYGARQARDYAAAGRVIERRPRAGEMLLAGAVCVSTLAVIEPWFTNEDLPLPAGVVPAEGADPEGEAEGPEPEGPEPEGPGTGERESGEWERAQDAVLDWARFLPDRELRRALDRCLAVVRTGATPVRRTVHLSHQGAADLDRTQVLVSRQKKRLVSSAEAVEHALRHYVSRHDLLEKSPRARRLGAMHARSDGKKHPRAVAAQVRRALMAEHGDVCAIEFCEHDIWLENSHHTAHALGGGNELVDQDRICWRHHRMKDSGEIRWIPPAEDGSGGHYETRAGKVLRIKPRKPPGSLAGRGPPEVEGSRDGPDAASNTQIRERTPPLLPSRRPPHGRREPVARHPRPRPRSVSRSRARSPGQGRPCQRSVET